MECEKCGAKMIIDSWDGWRWYCAICDHEGRLATDEEIHEFESHCFPENAKNDETNNE